MARLSRNDGMYWGALTDIIHPLFPIGIKIPKSIGSPLGSAHHGGLFSEAEQLLERHKRRDIPLAGECATTRVRHGPCPPVPLPPARRTGVSQDASRPRSPSRGGAHHKYLSKSNFIF